MASKLTQSAKSEILSDFRSGRSLSALAKEHGCTPSTITRTIKSFIDDNEYAELIDNKKKNRTKKTIEIDSQINSYIPENSNSNQEESSLNDELGISREEDPNPNPPYSTQNSEFFTEIVPLNADQHWDEQKEVACIPLDKEALPEVVYMLIDKKVELESRPLKDFAEWSFLPDEDQERFAIPLFSNQRDAKRSCSRNQKVLKVPDSKVFITSSSYLLAKGITRLIIDDSLISIDK